MSITVGLPFNPKGYETKVGTLRLGDTFVDERGREWTLYALSNDLTSDTLAANEVCYIAATNVTLPTSQTITFADDTTTVAQYFTVTNTVANALNTNGGTSQHFAGIADGTIGEAASSAAADVRFVLLMTKGVHLVKTNGDGDISAGDHLITSGNGTCNSISGTSSTAETEATLRLKFGTAMTADDTAGTSVLAWVNKHID